MEEEEVVVVIDGIIGTWIAGVLAWVTERPRPRGTVRVPVTTGDPRARAQPRL